MAKKHSNEMTNFYELPEVKKMLTKYHNPGFDQTGIDIPCRILCCGGSGTGKTSFLLSLLSRMNDTFGHIHVVYKASETLYEFLEKKSEAKILRFTPV